MQHRPLTFGKYRGVPLASVPQDYLRWVLKNVGIARSVKTSIQAVLSGQIKPLKYVADNDGTSYDTSRYAPWAYEGPPGEIESRLKESDIPY